MKVGTYRLLYGGWYPTSVRSYVHKRVEALARKLSKELGEGYDVRFNGAKGSEASYIKIRNKTKGTTYNVSFRNHGDFQEKRYDEAIMLCKFDTWKDVKETFLTDHLPHIRQKLDVELPLQADIAREIEAAISRLLRTETGNAQWRS